MPGRSAPSAFAASLSGDSAFISRSNASMLDCMLCGLWCSSRQDHERDDDHGQRHEQEQQHAHDAHHLLTSLGATRSWASSPQASPPSHASCFQIGTDAFTASMQNRAAANASVAVRRRHHDDDRRLADGHDADAVEQHDAPDRRPPGPGLVGDRCSRGTTCSSYASYSSCSTPGRSGAWSRAVPLNTTTAPQSRPHDPVGGGPTGKLVRPNPNHTSPESAVASRHRR